MANLRHNFYVGTCDKLGTHPGGVNGGVVLAIWESTR